ncbi:penicillin-binding protein 2 [Nannocystis radixulma]|uniref:Penicillin-binding protein 2 n=1 Tax=Nannocystis radixulma TaxID=2995305 RepID=A0ABT5BS55_9BACT|nr:penicillin-binding protein 2 [Nannocystis radixulma]MDC0675817.1 penicillin-binding protein 2 [Nannocystis radixulma]
MTSLREPDDLRALRPRLQAMVVVVLLAFLVLLGRLCQLQVLEGEHYVRRAERNFIDTIEAPALRGRIFDAQGRPLASNRPAYTLYVTARPRVVVETDDPGARSQTGSRVPLSDAQIDALADLVDFVDAADREQFVAAIVRRRDRDEGIYPFAVRGNLTWQEFARIQTRKDALGDWLEIRESARRFYPAGELTAFVTGYVGEITPEGLANSAGSYRPGDRVGKTGMERQWENYLRGRPGKRSRVVDVHHHPVKDPPRDALAALPPDEDPIPGQDVYLTLDLDLQRVAAEAFADKPAGALVAIEPDTGRIVAMLSVPAIDPNRWQQPIGRDQYKAWSESLLKPFIDRTVQEHYFPGSTYKVVSALAALDDPTFDPEKTITCDGYVNYGGRRFKCTHKHGPVNLEQAIVQSCNVYFYTLAIDTVLSLERMELFARRLGLGERTGIGINSEAKGRIPTEAFEAREGTYQRGVRLNSAIGQGNVTATVLQVAVLYAAIANGGRVMTPYIVDRIETPDRRLVLQNKPQVRRDLEPVLPADRDRIHAGLTGVVNNELGTAYSERLGAVVVAGKTGTAQVGALDKKTKTPKIGPIPGFDFTQDHAWFAGYAPADAPKIVVVAFVEHGGVGADAAAPIVMKVIESYLGSRSETPQPRRPGGVPPPLPGQRNKDSLGDSAPGPDRAVALTGARLPGDRPLGPPPPKPEETGPSGHVAKTSPSPGPGGGKKKAGTKKKQPTKKQASKKPASKKQEVLP